MFTSCNVLSHFGLREVLGETNISTLVEPIGQPQHYITVAVALGFGTFWHSIILK